MIRRFASAALLLAAMSLTLLALFLSTPRGMARPAMHPGGVAHPVDVPHPHAGRFASGCPALPHGVSPRPPQRAKAVIRT